MYYSKGNKSYHVRLAQDVVLLIETVAQGCGISKSEAINLLIRSSELRLGGFKEVEKSGKN